MGQSGGVEDSLKLTEDLDFSPAPEPDTERIVGAVEKVRVMRSSRQHRRNAKADGNGRQLRRDYRKQNDRIC